MLVNANEMPLYVMADYLLETYIQDVYKENCMWLLASANIKKEHRDNLVQPYLQNINKLTKQNRAKKMSYEETIDFIFS